MSALELLAALALIVAWLGVAILASAVLYVSSWRLIGAIGNSHHVRAAAARRWPDLEPPEPSNLRVLPGIHDWERDGL